MVAAPDTKPKPPEPASSAQPRTAEVAPSPTATQPDAASDAPVRAAKVSDNAPARSEPMVGAAEPPAQGAADEQDVVGEKPAEPPAAKRAIEPAAHAPVMRPRIEGPPPQPRAADRSPERRMPAPVHVEAAPPKALPPAAARVVSLREVRTPERPLPPPRVEFAVAGEPVSVLPRPAAVQDRAPSARERLPGPPASDKVSTAAAVAPRPSTGAAREPPTSATMNRDPAAPAPLARQSLPAPTPALVPAAPMPPVRREAENTISIRQLDIQIVAEESRRPPGGKRSQPAPAAPASVPLDRYYVREMP
jgi:hypothetical protein